MLHTLQKDQRVVQKHIIISGDGVGCVSIGKEESTRGGDGGESLYPKVDPIYGAGNLSAM
jgi:hypothetical protein